MTKPDLIKSVTAYIDGDDGTDEWDVDLLLQDCADEIVKLRAQLAGVREKVTPDVVRILRLLSDEKSRPITLHIGYGQQLAAMADVLAALGGDA